MKYKPSEEKLNCTICGIDTPETIEGTPLCFDCIEQMQTGDRSDIVEAVDFSNFETRDKSIRGIIQKVQEYSGIKDITIKTRKREICEVRQIAHFLARAHTDITLAKIGYEIGNKDHATVLNSCKTVTNLLTDKSYLEKYSDLIEYYN